MPLDIGRVTHLLEQMHRSEDDAGDPIAEGQVLVTDGARGFTWEALGSSDADTVATVGGGSGLPGDTVQEDLDYLANLLGLVGTGGTLTAGGSPVAVTNDSTYNAFPGLARLTADTVIIVYRKGTDHASTNDGRIVGKLGTLAADYQSVSAWGSEFEIYDHATLDVRCEDAVSVIDNHVWVSGRHYDGSDNQAPFVLLCDDPASSLSETSTWTKHDITMAQGSVQNYTQGHLLKLADGSYLQPVGWDSGGNHTVGAALVTDPTDWSAPSFETIGSGANDYSEIGVIMWPDGTLRAHMKADGPDDHYWSESTDDGATWSAPVLLFDATGYPAFRRLPSGLHLTVYRSNAGTEDAAWRQSDDDVTYDAETILDTTGSQMEYASILALTRTTALVAYGVQNSSSDSDIRTQLFTDDSVFSISISGTDELVKVSSDDTTAGYLNGKLVAGTGISLTEGSPGGNETLTIAATGGGGTAVPTGILLESGHAVPFTFDEILQESDGSDFLWASA